MSASNGPTFTLKFRTIGDTKGLDDLNKAQAAATGKSKELVTAQQEVARAMEAAGNAAAEAGAKATTAAQAAEAAEKRVTAAIKERASAASGTRPPDQEYQDRLGYATHRAENRSAYKGLGNEAGFAKWQAEQRSKASDDDGFLSGMSDWKKKLPQRDAVMDSVPAWLREKRVETKPEAGADFMGGLQKTGAEVAALEASTGSLLSLLGKVTGVAGASAAGLKAISAVWDHWIEVNPHLNLALDNTKTALNNVFGDVVDYWVGRGQWVVDIFDSITRAAGGETEEMKKLHQGLDGLVTFSDKALNAQEQLERGMKAVSDEAERQREVLDTVSKIEKINADNDRADFDRQNAKEKKEIEARIANLSGGVPVSNGGVSLGGAGGVSGDSGGGGGSASSGFATYVSQAAGTGESVLGGAASATPLQGSTAVDARAAQLQAARNALLDNEQAKIERDRANAKEDREREVKQAEERLRNLQQAADGNERLLQMQIADSKATNRLVEARAKMLSAKVESDRYKGQAGGVNAVTNEQTGGLELGPDGKPQWYDGNPEKTKADKAYEAAKKEVRAAVAALPANKSRFDQKSSQEALDTAKAKVKEDAERLAKAEAELASKKAENAAKQSGADQQAAAEDEASGATARKKAQEAEDRKARRDDGIVTAKQDQKTAKMAFGIDSDAAKEATKRLTDLQRQKALQDKEDKEGSVGDRQSTERTVKQAEAERYENAARKKRAASLEPEAKRKAKMLADEQLRKDKEQFEEQRHKDAILDPEHLPQLQADWDAKHPAAAAGSAAPGAAKAPAGAQPTASGKGAAGMGGGEYHEVLHNIDVNTRGGSGGKSSAGGNDGKGAGHHDSGKADAKGERTYGHSSKRVGESDGVTINARAGQHAGEQVEGSEAAVNGRTTGRTHGRHGGQRHGGGGGGGGDFSSSSGGGLSESDLEQLSPAQLATMRTKLMGMMGHPTGVGKGAPQAPKVIEAPKAKQGDALVPGMAGGKEGGAQLSDNPEQRQRENERQQAEAKRQAEEKAYREGGNTAAANLAVANAETAGQRDQSLAKLLAMVEALHTKVTGGQQDNSVLSTHSKTTRGRLNGLLQSLNEP